MKQTAVEWLEERFEKFLAYYEGHHKAEMYSIHQLSNDFDQAKETEKRQMIDAGNSCAVKQAIHNRKVDLMNLEQLEKFVIEETTTFGEEYYNETFKNK